MSAQFVQPASNGRKLRVLGVDPAVAGATGFGVIEIDGSGARLMRFGAWKLPSNVTFAVRLREIHFLVTGIVEQFRPDAVAVESVFTALNAGTALKLAEVRRRPACCRPGADSGAQLFAP
jgi:crossover junction endodeoxyribonuclease RuvC